MVGAKKQHSREVQRSQGDMETNLVFREWGESFDVVKAHGEFRCVDYVSDHFATVLSAHHLFNRLYVWSILKMPRTDWKFQYFSLALFQNTAGRVDRNVTRK